MAALQTKNRSRRRRREAKNRSQRVVEPTTSVRARVRSALIEVERDWWERQS